MFFISIQIKWVYIQTKNVTLPDQRWFGISWLVTKLINSCINPHLPTLQLSRFWNEPRCSRKYVGIEKYHSKFCLDVHDFSDHFNPPPPPVQPQVRPPAQPPQPPVNAGDILAPGGFGVDANALVLTPEKGKSQLNVNADKINAKFTIGYYSIIIKLSSYFCPMQCQSKAMEISKNFVAFSEYMKYRRTSPKVKVRVF